MTDAALQKGCDIEGSICHDPKTANALFEIGDWWSLEATHQAAPEKSIEYLINVGYDVEARNAAGLTPLLYTATTCKAHAVISLATLIRKGANVRAIDLAGRNALHCALAAPQIFDDWKSMRLVRFAEHTISNHYFLPAYVYHTQSLAHAEDYEDQLGDHEAPQVDAEEDLFRRQSNDRCQCGFQAGDDLSEGQAVNHPRIGIPTIVCNDFAGAEHTIRHPIQVLKMRMRFRLLTLMNANCDPNAFDKAGATPSDYARRDGLWPQWSWALIKAGFEYNVRGDCWVRRYAL